MTPISVVIITYNEEANIERCITSVRSIADEIVVVDSFSGDKTVELATKLGAKVFSNAFEGHIEQKNFAITKATNPHILSIDADEWLEEKLAGAIQQIKQQWTADGYIFNRLNNYCGKWIRHGAWYPDKKLRLWDSRKGRWQGTNPHDEFKMETGCTVSYLPFNILHQSYKTIEEHKKKSDYFSNIAAQAYWQKGIRSNLFKIYMSPVFRFIRDYVFKFGFLDGYYGWIIAFNTAVEVKKKYIKLYRLQVDRA